ncbi:MAG: shikimate kinase [Ruminococcus flavefaciens]|nr:shikimate kinase [Ruminococcus flavefaciens]
MTIFLCGFMGCGKSTIGQILAKKLGCGFCDTDELVVKNQGMTIPEIFSQKGEPYFRTVEAETVKSLCGKNTVVACGGGAMQNSDTAKAVSENGGTIVYLNVTFEECYNRIKGDTNRPIVMNNTKEQLEQIYNARREIYIKNSTVMVEAVGSPAEIAETIIDILR